MSQMTPPIEPDALPVDPPSWPKVVGIISIVWGVLGIGCGGCGLASPMLMNMMPPEQRAQMPPSMMSGGQMVAIAASMIINVVLISGGALTIGRKSVGRMLHLVYATLGIVSFPVGMFLQFQQQAVIDQWVRENPSTPFAQQSAAGGNMGMMIGIVMGVILGLAYPLFCGVWFGIIKRHPGSMGVVSEEDSI